MGAAKYSSPPSRTLSLPSLSDPKLEFCEWEGVNDDRSGTPCFNKSTCRNIKMAL